MHDEKLSARQLSVAAMVGGLSHAAAFSGSVDWRWALAMVPAGVLLGWLLLRRVGSRPLFAGTRGGVLAVLYGSWAMVLMSTVLYRTAERLQSTNAGWGDQVWILLLITLPLLWSGWREHAAFFRAVEIFWLAVVVLLAAILLFAIPRIQWQWLVVPSGNGQKSAAAMTLVMSTGLFLLPYIYKVKDERYRAVVWQGALGVFAAVLAAMTAGLLSPAVAGQVEQPFFVASGVLGESVRAEGLISTLWLLPDLTLVGLLARVWGGRRWAAVAIAFACGLALVGFPKFFSVETLALGTLVLALLTLLLPTGKGKIVV